ncbi:nudC domain-containing protein 2 [Panicum miliaceum]|uniref:NudC domain-containing protein 2 n=1 Tax=Panicum miliaceum TaxID=4540 RepID=A0A3L6RPY9_PANMI|nr:nudC domain-containing protein 2 [Panicum miliaceum]
MAEKLAPEKRHAFMHNGQKVFEWDQTLEEVNMYIELPKDVPTKLFRCTIQAGHVEVGVRGNRPYLNYDLAHPVKTDSSFWTTDGAGSFRSCTRSITGASAASEPSPSRSLLQQMVCSNEKCSPQIRPATCSDFDDSRAARRSARLGVARGGGGAGQGEADAAGRYGGRSGRVEIHRRSASPLPTSR